MKTQLQFLAVASLFLAVASHPSKDKHRSAGLQHKASSTHFGLKQAADATELCPLGLNYSPDNCNSCSCNPVNGISACTRMHCVTRVRPDEEKQASSGLKEAVGRCPHGLHWSNDGCNGCNCNPETGASACTMMMCYVKVCDPVSGECSFVHRSRRDWNVDTQSWREEA